MAEQKDQAPRNPKKESVKVSELPRVKKEEAIKAAQEVFFTSQEAELKKKVHIKVEQSFTTLMTYLKSVKED